MEHQLSGILQGNTSIDEFYANINHQFSLIVNKIKTEEYSTDTVEVLIETYRNRALDVFIRGLNGELSRMLMIQRPQTLPEAYTSCLEFQNLNYRNIVIHKKGFNNSVVAPINQLNSYPVYTQKKPVNFPVPQGNMVNIPAPQKNMVYNVQHQNNRITREPPPRPTGLKPPTPMSVDPSIQTRQVNYINRPTIQQDNQIHQPNNQWNYPNQQNDQPAFKREHSDQNIPRKNQRIYHLETQDEEELYNQTINEMSDVDICDQEEEQEDENTELNFMMGASLAYHT